MRNLSNQFKLGLNVFRLLAVVTAVSGLFVSCNIVGNSVGALGKKLKGKDGKQRYDINDPDGRRGGSQGVTQTRSFSELPNEADIVWAPEDPDIPIEEFEGRAVVDDKPTDNWYTDYKKAMQSARLQGKPLLIWFTSSRNSPFCLALNQELFSKNDFESWAQDNVIRLRVDSNVKSNDTKERTELTKYIESLKKRYKVMGNPVTIVLSPRGTIFGKYRGYKRGQSGFYWGRIRNAHRSAEADYSSWIVEMERKGYRNWTSATGKSVYAKAARYRGGRLWLIEPDGKKSVTHVNKLSVEDKLYIEGKLAEKR